CILLTFNVLQVLSDTLFIVSEPNLHIAKPYFSMNFRRYSEDIRYKPSFEFSIKPKRHINMSIAGSKIIIYRIIKGFILPTFSFSCVLNIDITLFPFSINRQLILLIRTRKKSAIIKN